MQTQSKLHNENLIEEDTKSKVTIRNTVFKHCNDGDTGIVFIKTENNRACRVTITDGEIDAISMRNFTGIEAASEIMNVGIKGSSFSQIFDLPYLESDAISSSDKLLEKLGYCIRNPQRKSN